MSRFPKQLTTKTSEAHYLIKVLGVSGVPKLATFALSLTTIPIVLRNVGAVQYGTYLYVVAALAICEVLIDFGVSAAAGRRLAELRASYPGALRSDIFAWARLQAVFLAGGFVPMVLVAYLLDRPDDARAIAEAGRRRYLRDYTMERIWLRFFRELEEMASSMPAARLEG